MMISEKDAMELLRKGRLLTRMHTKVGLKWFVIPGGQIADTVARKILARRDIEPHDGGLFPSCEQTFQMCAPKSQRV
jgi:hypothetical protein